MSKILFVSGSVGLGHIERDMAIAREVRRLKPGTEVHWMAGDPAREVLRKSGETILPESEDFDQGTSSLEASAIDYTADLMHVAYDLVDAFDKNGKLIWKIAKDGNYDVVVHDETYEVVTSLYKNRAMQACKSVFMSDYFGYWGPTKGIKGMMVKRVCNKLWLKGITTHHDIGTYILLCEREDIPNKKLGLLMPNAQDLVGQDFVKFAGYPLPYDPRSLPDKQSLRKEFKIFGDLAILVTVGGTNVAKPLIDLCIKTYPLIKKELPNASMTIVVGPNISPEEYQKSEAIDIRGYVPNLHRLMAACDIGICSGGASTTLEFMALRKPFLYFPLQSHFEQQVMVAGRNERLGAGIKMQFSSASPESLAKEVMKSIGKPVDVPKARFTGVEFAAKEVAALL